MPDFLLVVLPALPEVLIFLGTIGLLAVTLFFSSIRPSRSGWKAIWITFWIIVLMSNFYDIHEGLSFFGTSFDPMLRKTTFSGMMTIDIFLKLGKILLSLWTLFYVVSAFQEKSLSLEHLLAVSTAILGGFFILSANDIRLLFLGIEMMSTAILFLLKIDLKVKSDAFLINRLYVINGIGSALLLLGMAMVYPFSGSTDLISCLRIYEHMQSLPQKTFLLLGGLLSFCGLSAKVLLPPFHSLGFSLSRSQSNLLSSFVHCISRTVCIFFILKSFVWFDGRDIRGLFLFCGWIDVLIGSVSCFFFSHLSQVISAIDLGFFGVVLVGLGMSGLDAIPSLLFMLLSNSLSLMLLTYSIFSAKMIGCSVCTYSEIKPLFSKSLFLALCLVGSLLSFAGAPPFVGFVAFLSWAQNMLDHEAYATLIVMSLFKFLSWGVGVHVVKALCSGPTLTQTASCRLNRARLSVLFGITACLTLLFIQSESVLDKLTLAETSIRNSKDSF